MNLDNVGDFSELSTSIDNYVLAEFVCIPPNFNLEFHMSMHERIGIFESKAVNVSQLKIITDSIKSAPLFATMNNATLHPSSIFYLLGLFNELNLVIKTLDNPLRRFMSDDIYKHFSTNWQSSRTNHVRGQDVKRISFLVINLFYIFSDNVYNEVNKRVKEIEEMQKAIDDIKFKLD